MSARPARLTGDVLRRFLESSRREVMVYDAEHRRRYFNAAAIRRAGAPWEELRGRTWSGTRDLEFAYVRGTARGEPISIAMTREVTSHGFTQPQAEALIEIALTYAVERPLNDTLAHLAAAITGGTDAGAGLIAMLTGTPARVFAGGASFPTTDSFWREVERTWQTPGAADHLQASRGGEPVATQLAHPRDSTLHGHPAGHQPREWSVTVPLAWRHRSLGILTADFPEGREPDEPTLAFLGAVANQAAVVLANAQLFRETQARAAIEERGRLARELHDSVSQALYGIGLGARTARTLVERDPAAAIAPLDYVLELTETAFAEMRALIFELSHSLAREGLRTALEGQIAALTARHGLPISFAAPAEPELGLPAKEALYRIGIEALHNVVKHARARRVAVTLTEGAGHVSLSVADDGVGFEAEAAFPGHLGLESMRQRAEAAGGQLRVESRPGSGTTVTATLPGLA